MRGESDNIPLLLVRWLEYLPKGVGAMLKSRATIPAVTAAVSTTAIAKAKSKAKGKADTTSTTKISHTFFFS